MANVYEIVTSRIIEKLEQGVIPWRRPWLNNGSVNWESQRAYNGINAILLDPGEYATFNQIKKAGGTVKKGEKSHMVIFWKWFEDEETGERKPMMRYYNVFEINTQCEGMKSNRKAIEVNNDPIGNAETIVKGYQDAPLIAFAPGKAYYKPSSDIISVPQINDYLKPAEYYSTLFHEMAHSTGHKKRLNRATITTMAAFGSETYSREELIAEITATFLCDKAGIIQETLDNSAAYIASWKKFLKNDSRAIVTAASQAQKAANYILGIIEKTDIAVSA